MGKRKTWSWSTGERPHTVAVYELRGGSTLYGRWFDPALKRQGEKFPYRRLNLKHRDKDAAKLWATTKAGQLMAGMTDALTSKVPTVGLVFGDYGEALANSDKCPQREHHERRTMEMWSAYLGDTFDLRELEVGQWNRFKRDRERGALGPRGQRVAPEDQRPVGKRVIQADCDWLHQVYAWAMANPRPSAPYVSVNPLDNRKAFTRPTQVDATIQRPVTTWERYLATREVAPQVMMERRMNGTRETVPSYLLELVDLAWWTGHRIGAIRQLRYSDLRLDEGDHGAIAWPEMTDKTGKPHNVPLSEPSRAAIGRILTARPSIGAVYLFPSPTNPEEPIKRQLPRDWLLKAEELAELPKLEQGLWHPYRRGFATERKEEPIADLARAGGWSEHGETLRRCYLHPDPATLRKVVNHGVDRWRQAVSG